MQYDWLPEVLLTKEEWRYLLMDCGARFVTTVGAGMTPELFVANWDSPMRRPIEHPHGLDRVNIIMSGWTT